MDCRNQRKYNRDAMLHLCNKGKNPVYQDTATDVIRNSTNVKRTFYSSYWCSDRLQEALKSNQVISGNLRINPKRFTDCYVGHPVFESFTGKIREGEENKTDKYVSLDECLTKQRSYFEQLLGARFVESLLADLDTNADPVVAPVSQSADVNDSGESACGLSWWSVFQRTGHVVGCLQKLHSRVCIGYLQLQRGNRRTSTKTDELDNGSSAFRTSNWAHAVLVPIDSRLPRVLVPKDGCPIDANHVIETETDRILISAGFVNGIDGINNFPEQVKPSVEQDITEFSKPDRLRNEYRLRRDFRSHCVFSIDPSTARDLDDALHLHLLTDEEKRELASKGVENAVYEVGVHIADVSYFVRAGSPADVEASRRATSIYLTQLCVPMLPGLLSERVCSLNPCGEKLTFSVVFTVSHDAKILKTWFGRTVIRSCARLSYEEAQSLIDCDSVSDLDASSLPEVEAPHSIVSVYERIQKLHQLAKVMRQSRFLGGSLQLNQVRPSFVLDDSKQLPIGLASYVTKPSNWLIEEWMLAANQAVACRIANGLPQTALLRRHAAPSLKRCVDAANQLSSLGINVDTVTAQSIQASLCREAGCSLDTDYQYSADLPSFCADMVDEMPTVEDELIGKLCAVDMAASPTTVKSLPTSSSPSKAVAADRMNFLERESRLLVTVTMLTKIMNLAKYFCLGMLRPGQSTQHYALNMPFYTHFTSPIRRFADIIVHRQLAAVLADEALAAHDDELAKWYGETALSKLTTPAELNYQAEICNSKKLSAHQASLDSAELFFTLFVKETGPLVEAAVVISVKDRSFDVLLLSNGITQRVRIKSLDLRSIDYTPGDAGESQADGVLCLTWNYPPTSDDVEIGSDSPRAVTVGSGCNEPPCGCFLSQIRVLDIMRCRVEVESKPSSPTRDCREKGGQQTPVKEQQHYYRGGDDLPRQRVTMLRPSCEKCVHLRCDSK